MPGDMCASYDMAVWADTHIILIDRDEGASITHEAVAVVAHLDRSLPGGIGQRRVYYLDATHRFNELKVWNGQFAGFASCTAPQQAQLAAQLGHAKE